MEGYVECGGSGQSTPRITTVKRPANNDSTGKGEEVPASRRCLIPPDGASSSSSAVRAPPLRDEEIARILNHGSEEDADSDDEDEDLVQPVHLPKRAERLFMSEEDTEVPPINAAIGFEWPPQLPSGLQPQPSAQPEPEPNAEPEPTILVLDRKFNMFHRFINSICTRKEIKKDKRINELTEIIQKRMAMEKANQPGQNSLYPNLDDPSPPGRRKLSGQISPAISLIGLAIANSLGSAKACDDLMFLNSNGLMFRDNTLSESSNGMSIFHVRSSLCLKFQNGSTESITLNKLTRIDRHEAIYKACDFKIESKSTFSCLGSGYCWDEGSGNANSRLQAVGPDACNVPNGQHGCIISPNLSSSGCTHEQICIWYYWKRIPTINKCDPIYELSSSTIIGHMDYTDPKGNIIPFSLSESNPMTHGHNGPCGDIPDSSEIASKED
ncbi:unnamed protein product [Arctia plantaginis]|uniref:Uncharacterized protein n=1 Tax=Arctia plantaginis TaxID=874455 RepID=A0A8S1AAL7_ARCPL|nr:unnamed protein product [Arctia plantaginis]